MVDKDISGKVAIVTGGISGMGEACSRKLLDLGAAVVAVDRNEDRGAELERELSSDAFAFRPLDITDMEAIQAVVAEVERRHGRLDMLINAAGIFTANAPAEKIAPDDFRRTFEVNLLGTVQMCQACFPLLSGGEGGAIANIASQAALVSLPEQAAYTASKGAVAAVTRSLAVDWAPKGVRVNAICPGFTVTPMSQPAMTEELKKAVARRVPLGRVFQPIEMANALIFLVGPWSSAITGVVLPVDGGWTAGEPDLPQW